MHSILARSNAIFAFSLTLVGVLAIGLYGTTFIYNKDGPVTLKTDRIIVKKMTEYGVGKKKNDLGLFTFDMNVDLEPLFNWNVKQLFLFLTVEYQTKQNVII
jgi:signal peptidase complex subunit 3